MKSLFLLVALLMGVVSAGATLLTFEDLQAACDAHPAPYPIPGDGTATPYSVAVPNGYAGVNWNNFYAIDAPANAAYFGETVNGEVNGLVSGAICIFNNYANPASILETTLPITLHSAYLSGVWNDGLIVQADAYLGGVLQYSRTVTTSAYHPTFVSYEFTDVDQIVWTSRGGTPAGFPNGGSGTHFAMDNLSFELVPEPSIGSLVCSAVGLALIVKRRKKNGSKQPGSHLGLSPFAVQRNRAGHLVDRRPT